jgi:hypothetical protein
VIDLIHGTSGLKESENMAASPDIGLKLESREDDEGWLAVFGGDAVGRLPKQGNEVPRREIVVGNTDDLEAGLSACPDVGSRALFVAGERCARPAGSISWRLNLKVALEEASTEIGHASPDR